MAWLLTVTDKVWWGEVRTTEDETEQFLLFTSATLVGVNKRKTRQQSLSHRVNWTNSDKSPTNRYIMYISIYITYTYIQSPRGIIIYCSRFQREHKCLIEIAYFPNYNISNYIFINRRHINICALFYFTSVEYRLTLSAKYRRQRSMATLVPHVNHGSARGILQSRNRDIEFFLL